MKSFVAEDSFWELFPQAAVGVVVVKGMKPAAQIPQEDVDAIATLLNRANIDAERHLTSDTISESAPVKAWREAYRLFKTKKGARCSVENLLKRVLKGKPVGHITPAVDIYNTVSLTYALPVGGEDLHAIEGGPSPEGDRRWRCVLAAWRGGGRSDAARRARLHR